MNTEVINDRTYPRAPGFKGQSETSRQSAARVADKAALQRKQIMAAYERQDLTHDEVAEIIRPKDISDVEFETFKRGVRSRCSELKGQGKLEATAQRRANPSGHKAVVWRKTMASPVVTIIATSTTGTRATQQDLI